MKKVIFALMLASLSGLACAGSASENSLVTQCEKLKRQTDRSACIKEAIRSQSSEQVVRKKEEIPDAAAQEVSFPRATEESWRRSITIKTDNFAKDITYSTSKSTEGLTYGGPEYTWATHAYVEKASKRQSFMISFIDIYSGNRWKFWRYADSDKAEKFEVVSGNRKVTSCSRYTGCLYSESLGIIISKEFLVSAANEGREIKLQSSNGDSFIFKIPSDEAANLLSAVDACKNTGCEPAEIKVSKKIECSTIQLDSPNYSLLPDARGAGC